MPSFRSPLACLLLASFVCAQDALVRGKVEDVPGTQNQFFLDGTVLPVVSTALDLNAWTGQHAVLQVTDVGAPGSPVLRVDGATATARQMDMGNMRLGQTSTWRVTAPSGSFALIAVDFTGNTGFAPLPGLGTYLLGPSPVLVAAGFTTAPGLFQVSLLTPPDQTLLDLEVSAQALVVEPGDVWYFTNADSKVVEP